MEPLRLSVKASVDVSASVIESALVQDLQKYAGFDAGVLYAPRLDEMRSFLTLNIYPMGPVSLTPEGTEVGKWHWLWERLSLTFGYSVGDISGGDDSKTKIRGENAFVYGLGVRLNKYFRVTMGGLVYRTDKIDGVAGNLTNKLRHELMVGPSVDLTALPGLKTIFASATGEKR